MVAPDPPGFFGAALGVFEAEVAFRLPEEFGRVLRIVVIREVRQGEDAVGQKLVFVMEKAFQDLRLHVFPAARVVVGIAGKGEVGEEDRLVERLFQIGFRVRLEYLNYQESSKG